MGSGRLRLAAAAILAAVIALPLSAGYTDIDALLEQTDTQLQWDSTRRVGAIWRGTDVLSFRPGSEWAVYNFRRQVRVGEIRLDDSQLLFSDEARAAISDLFIESDSRVQRRVAAIFIDPGHGGKDPGAVGGHTGTGENHRVYEKDIVLAAALELQRLLTARYPGRQIILSRSTDEYLSLQRRTQIANEIVVQENETILFISLHANASLNKQAQGYEVWYLPEDHRRSGLVDAEQSGVDDPDVLAILNTLKEEEYTIESVLLARSMVHGIQEQIGSLTPNRGIKKESWFVVRQAKMPAALVELGFVTNSEEAARLSDSVYLRQLSRGIFNGIVSFVHDFEQ